MIKVEKTAKTLDEGIKNLMAGAKLDYEKSVSYTHLTLPTILLV